MVFKLCTLSLAMDNNNQLERRFYRQVSLQTVVMVAQPLGQVVLLEPNLTTSAWFETTAPSDQCRNFGLQAGQIRSDSMRTPTGPTSLLLLFLINTTRQFIAINSELFTTMSAKPRGLLVQFHGRYSQAVITEPAIDFHQDGLLEWGGSDNRVSS